MFLSQAVTYQWTKRGRQTHWRQTCLQACCDSVYTRLHICVYLRSQTLRFYLTNCLFVSTSYLCPSSCLYKTCRCVSTHKHSPLQSTSFMSILLISAVVSCSMGSGGGHCSQFNLVISDMKDSSGFSKITGQHAKGWDHGVERKILTRTCGAVYCSFLTKQTRWFVQQTHPALIDICSTKYVSVMLLCFIPNYLQACVSSFDRWCADQIK